MDARVTQVVSSFKAYHLRDAEYVFSCGGRFEVLGNHTDHNHGLCIASSCDLDIIAAVSKYHEKGVRLKSVGFPVDEVDLTKLDVDPLEAGTSTGIIRGVARYLIEHGYKVGGFDAYTSSSIFKGAGVSSSAAFELLIGHIFNSLFNDGKIPLLTLCKAGQYAENKYFGKKSGLLDQIGVAYGGMVEIDFKDVDNPIINKIEFPFKDLHFVIVNTGGDHSTLSNLYSSIPEDMFSAANQMKVRFLRDASSEELEEQKAYLPTNEYLRAKHFYDENKRVLLAVEAMKNGDKETFLKLINESRVSSTNNLKNMMVENKYEGSPLEACDLLMKASEGEGAVKINGGGFAGSIIAVIPTSKLAKVIKVMSKKYGADNVKEISIREKGPLMLYKLK